MPPSFDVLTATSSDLRKLLHEGSLCVIDIVETHLAQTEKHNRAGATLHAIISIPKKSQLLQIAESLDAELRAGKPRSPLHGILIIIKVKPRRRHRVQVF